MSAHLLDSENPTTAPGQFFDSEAVETLIADYQRTGSVQILGQIVERSRPIFVSLIRARHTFQYQDEDELLSTVNRKLLISLSQYDPKRGTAFVSRLTLNMLCTSVTLQKKPARRYEPLSAFLAANTPDDKADFESGLAVADLVQQIRKIRSAVTVTSERDAQKWYVESFIDAHFEMRRHQCADAAMKVYGLSHRRSRQLFDLTVLEIRRLLWEETKHEPMTPARLKGTKGLPLVRYVNFLSPQEFSKFAALMKDLAPSLVVLMKPSNESKIKAGNWPAVRENLQLVLEGDPQAWALFPP